jgi:hypothetical protein
MKVHVDKSMGIVTRIAEALARIKPTDPLRLAKREVREKRKCSDSSGNSPAKILASRYACKNSSLVKSSYTRPESAYKRVYVDKPDPNHLPVSRRKHFL